MQKKESVCIHILTIGYKNESIKNVPALLDLQQQNLYKLLFRKETQRKVEGLKAERRQPSLNILKTTRKGQVMNAKVAKLLQTAPWPRPSSPASSGLFSSPPPSPTLAGGTSKPANGKVTTKATRQSQARRKRVAHQTFRARMM